MVINGRDEDRLRLAAESIAPASLVATVCADISSVEGREALLAAAPDADILVTNNGGPTPGRFLHWDEAAWIEAIEANMLSAVMLMRAVVPGMRKRRWGRIVNITSAMVKAPRIAMGLSTASRAGLTAVAKAVSRDVARDGVTINNLLPERIATARLDEMIARVARARGEGLDAARAEMLAPVPAGRFGTPEEFGAACAFLCSEQAGYITGQNLSVDGGGYDGLI